jgi:hypothetical protein
VRLARDRAREQRLAGPRCSREQHAVGHPAAQAPVALGVALTPTRRPVMFKNVLVEVDGRPNGRDAIALASHLTDPDGKLTLGHVHTGDLRPSHAIAPGLVREEREASHKLLEQERAAADVKAELTSIVSMSPGRGLHEQGKATPKHPMRSVRERAASPR